MLTDDQRILRLTADPVLQEGARLFGGPIVELAREHLSADLIRPESLAIVPTLDDLLALADTEHTRQHAQALAAAAERTVSAAEKKRLLARLRPVQRRADWCLVRDKLQAQQRARGASFSACWCLGQGGRGPRALPGSSRPVYDRYCDCPDGRAREAADAEQVGLAQGAAERRRRAARFDASRVPATYRGLSLASWAARATQAGGAADEVADRLSDISTWWENVRAAYAALPGSAEGGSYPPSILMLAGAFGAGKTGCALAILQQALDLGLSGLFWTFPELLLSLQATYGERGQGNEWDLLEAARETDLLVLDDWGAEAPAGASSTRLGWLSERLHAVLEERLKQGRPTILTTNRTSAAIKRRISPEVFSRLAPDRCSTKVVFRTPSLRLAEREVTW